MRTKTALDTSGLAYYPENNRATGVLPPLSVAAPQQNANKAAGTTVMYHPSYREVRHISKVLL
jgi:hypothetical protein